MAVALAGRYQLLQMGLMVLQTQAAVAVPVRGIPWQRVVALAVQA